MKNNVTQINGERSNVSFGENQKGIKNQNKGKENMKRHFLAIMERIAAERQRGDGISMY